MIGVAPLRRPVLALASATLYLLVFCALVVSGKTEVGIGRFFYLAIALAALATGPLSGAAAGVLASGLYAVAVLVNEPAPRHILISATNGFRVVTYAALGVLVGSIASRNRALVSRLHLLAARDPLTGLGNARAFEEAQHRRFGSGKPFALLLADMDGLKRINDERGHAAGDDSLRSLAVALAGAIGPGDEAFRIGGDEFAVLTDASTAGGAARTVADIASDLAAEGHRLSIGWALAPDEGENAVFLYRSADARMYERKRLGRPQSADGDANPFDNPRSARVPRWSDSLSATEPDDSGDDREPLKALRL